MKFHRLFALSSALLALSSTLLAPAVRAASASKDTTLSGTTTLTGTVSKNATNTFLTGAAVTFNAGSTLTVSGAMAGTPTGGTLSLTNLTLTLPSSFSFSNARIYDDSNLHIKGELTSGGAMILSGSAFGFTAAADSAAHYTVNATALISTTQYWEASELSADPAAPATNKARAYFRDNGSGKTQFVIRFPTGAIQVIATEP